MTRPSSDRLSSRRIQPTPVWANLSWLRRSWEQVSSTISVKPAKLRSPLLARLANATTEARRCHTLSASRHSEMARAHAAPCRSTNGPSRSEEHTSELQSRQYLVCRLLLEKKNKAAEFVSTNSCSAHAF